MASTSSGREKALPVRSTRGKRLAAQLEEQDAGADEEFWNQDFFAGAEGLRVRASMCECAQKQPSLRPSTCMHLRVCMQLHAHSNFRHALSSWMYHAPCAMRHA
eukprot:200734-Chlamydomonas_euryale.AAC.1